MQVDPWAFLGYCCSGGAALCMPRFALCCSAPMHALAASVRDRQRVASEPRWHRGRGREQAARQLLQAEMLSLLSSRTALLSPNPTMHARSMHSSACTSIQRQRKNNLLAGWPQVRTNVLAAYLAGGKAAEVPAVMEAMKVGV